MMKRAIQKGKEETQKREELNFRVLFLLQSVLQKADDENGKKHVSHFSIFNACFSPPLRLGFG